MTNGRFIFIEKYKIYNLNIQIMDAIHKAGYARQTHECAAPLPE